MFQGKEFFSKILIVIKRSKWNWAWWRKNMLLVPWYSFLQNWFYSLWCLQRPPASVGVLWSSTNTYRELWRWEDFRLHAHACPVWFCRFRAFCFNRCEWKSKNKFKMFNLFSRNFKKCRVQFIQGSLYGKSSFRFLTNLSVTRRFRNLSNFLFYLLISHILV